MIILAGVSIATLTGDSGLLTRTRTATKSYEQKEIEEQVEIAKYKLEFADKKITAENIKNYLTKDGFEEEDIEILPKDDDYEILKIKEFEFEIPIYKVTLYFDKGESWSTDTIYAYIWTDAGKEYKAYPGVKAELVYGTDNIYKYTVPEDYEGSNIIFNNGIRSGTSMIQTIDLKMAENGYIFRNTDAESRDVYFRTNWAGTLNIHMWNDNESTTWPGIQMEYIKEIDGYKYYKYTLPEKYDNFLFVQINDDGNVGTQTRDLSFLGGNKMYRLDGQAIVYSNGYWEKYV